MFQWDNKNLPSVNQFTQPLLHVRQKESNKNKLITVKISKVVLHEICKGHPRCFLEKKKKKSLTEACAFAIT